MRTWTSRKGEYPGNSPTVALKVRVSDWGTLYHQNSSVAWPLAETEKTARRALRGKLEMVFVASWAGTVNWLTHVELVIK